MKSTVIRSLFCLSLMVIGFLGMACTETAKEQSFVGQQSHERHATGVDSQRNY